MIDKGIIKKVSQLARIEMSDEELPAYAAQLDEILAYFNTLKEQDTDRVEPSVHAIDLKGPVRHDAAEPSPPRDVLMGNTRHSDKGFYIVPKIIE